MDIRAEIKLIIEQLVDDDSIMSTVSYDTNLVESEIMDSIILVQLVSEMEAVFKIGEIDGDDIVLENFMSINCIAGLIERYLFRG